MKNETGVTQHFAKAIEALKELPVAKVVKDVVKSSKEGRVALLTGETGSGKTLLGNAEMADASNHQVVVLVPRRFLAINAAESVAELAGLEVGKEVGYGIGSQSSDRSKFSPDTKLLFCTYGYALRSGLLDTAKTIVCDEVHEAGLDISLARAMLHKRMQHDKSLRVLEMSATLNAPKQAKFWEDVASTAIHHAEGKTFPCEFRQVNPDSKSLPRVIRDLIKTEGRKGVAVFLPGVKEVEALAERMREISRESGMGNVEVATIYGDMDMEERQNALKPPAKGNVKILIGTNVIESGMNVKWLDTGVSDGTGKVPYFRENGAEALIKEDLPQWRIVQQEGRVKRFTNGIFVLYSDLPKEERDLEATPEISRISLNSLVMHAARYNINPLDLKYDAPVSKSGLLQAKKELQRLNLLNDDWTYTEKGEFVASLPLGAEAGSMMWGAPQEIRSDAMELVAIAEVGGLRADFESGHGFDDRSDTLDALKAFRKLGMEAAEEDCEKYNVSWKRYQEARDLVVDLHRRLDKDTFATQRPANEQELIQVLLHGSVNRLFEKHGETYFDLIRQEGNYKEDACSVVSPKNSDRFAVAKLREIPTKGEDEMVIALGITKLPKEALCEFAANYPGALTNITFSRNDKGRDNFTGRYFGKSSITLNIPQDIPDGMRRLIEPGYSEFIREHGERPARGKPQGTDNTQALEEAPAQVKKKRAR
jgi:HrpA-like RNA helicase